MRVAFVVWPAPAHLFPFVPLAWALRSAGHEVSVLSHPSLGAEVSASGLPFMPLCEEDQMPRPKGPAAEYPEARDEVERITRALSLSAAELDRWNMVSQGFIPSMWDFTPYGGSPLDPMPAMDGMVAFFRAWRPDLVVWDPCMPGAAVAARATGARQARMSGTDYNGWFLDTFARVTSAPGGPDVPNPLAETIRGMAERYSVPIDHATLYGEWTIDTMPPGANFPVNTRKVPMRWIPYAAQVPTPDWLYPVPERPRVAVSLGMSIRAFIETDWSFTATLLEGLSGLDIEVVATLNKAQLADVPVIPRNVRAVDYLPLDYLMPTCSALIHHGGLGTMGPAGYFGVPQLIVDFFGTDADGKAPLPEECEEEPESSQYHLLAPVTGSYVTSFGAGEIIDLAQPRDRVIQAIRDQVSRVVMQLSFREGAEQLRRDMLVSPSPADLVPTLERLAQAR
jgi:hypothetical protein